MAIEAVQESHRPGKLKQQNKPHKHGRHRSKGSLEILNKGRVLSKAIRRKAKHEISKIQRRKEAEQRRHKQREELIMQKRRGVCNAPYLVAVVPLSEKVNIDNIIPRITSADAECTVTHSPEGYVHVSVPRFKERFCFMKCSTENMFDVLDALKVAETVVFVVGTDGIDTDGELFLTAVLAQGLPTTIVTLVDLETVPQKKRNSLKSEIQKAVNRWLPDEKLMTLEKESDSLILLRTISNKKQRHVIQRDNRPHMLVEEAVYVQSKDPQGCNILKVSGYLRGQRLSVNSLIHIPGWGDFRMKQIDAPDHPFFIIPDKTNDISDPEIKVLDVADPSKQESLETENPIDPMEGEQTWPTAEELAEAEAREAHTKKVKRIPVGMSDYQAAWIPDCDAEEVDNDEDDDDKDDIECDMDVQSEEASESGEDEEQAETMTVTSEAPIPDEKYDQQTDLTEEQEILAKIKEARADQMFPDEVDTPFDVPARIRFQKYRGLQSFRTSPWDPKENLPQDYARIFQFQNFNRTKKRIFEEQEQRDGAEPGWYIIIHIEGVSEELFHSRPGTQPLVLYGMLPYEQKMSVINMVLKRPTCLNIDEPIKSKEELIFQCGYRRFKACPIFSQHTNGSKHKYERYFQCEGTIVATIYAPIMFPPCSVLVFKDRKDGTQNLVATGNLLSVNPDRVIIKRVVLSGHPMKVHKRSAVVRFMFFNREDIEWFKKIELRTKYGRHGHIKEPLGTHGHMKCVFDGQLKSQDTVLLNLYKRVFPKWTYNPVVTVDHNSSMDTQ